MTNMVSLKEKKHKIRNSLIKLHFDRFQPSRTNQLNEKLSKYDQIVKRKQNH